MSIREITVLTDVSLITCMVQRGIADKIVQAAQEAGAQGATVYYARGEGVRERLGILALVVEVDKEVINVVVAKDQADRILERMYIAGNLDTPGMGFIYLTPLEKAATYIPREIAEKLSTAETEAKRTAVSED